MAEQIDLTVPEVVPSKTTNFYRVILVKLDVEKKEICIWLRGQNGEKRVFFYFGADAETFMKFINTANFSTNSLHKRILQRLSAEGKLVGTVSGVPDV